MKTNACQRRMRGLTRIDLIYILICVILLAFFLLPAVYPPRTKPLRIMCVNNLKQLNLAFRIWPLDGADDFPPMVSTNKGGSREWIGSQDIFRHFQAASNEIGSIGNPKILVCPADKDRAAAPDMASLKNNNLSYFVNLAVPPLHTPGLVFLGDRNLTLNGKALTTGNYLISTQQVLKWGSQLHRFQGNIGISDGSVWQVNDARLNAAFINGGLATNHLAVP